MKSRTLQELRELAKARGLRGYSKLTKDELIRRLESKTTSAEAPRKSAAKAEPKKSAKKSEPKRSERRAKPRTEPRAPAESVPPPATPAPVTAAAEPATTEPTHYASTEEQVEGAKYALRPNGLAGTLPATDLNEDIDRLPALADPMVCLMPQKPGILHAYWVLPPGEAAGGEYRVRLCRPVDGTLEVAEEVPVRADRGSWYFHVSERTAESGVMVQLGYYREGRFHSARGRSIARLPSLYASTRTDDRWWVPEAEFMQMYLRAGGFVTPARRFAWVASIGSPGAAPDQGLAWPGGVSSRA